ncbi:MAG TPA: VWA domain-containing protein [Terriglobales bacterium]
MHKLNRASRAHFSAKHLGAGLVALFIAAVAFFPPHTNGQQTAQAPAPADAQQKPPAPPAANSSSQSSGGEMDIKDEKTVTEADSATTFRANVRLVLAPVIVRDNRGKTVDNLQKEDFQLFDNGKPQAISHFAVEHLAPGVTPPAATTSTDASKPAPPAPVIPGRYFVYLFDDIHLSFGDLNRVRGAAEHRVENLPPSDRVAVFTTSGRTTLDFTADTAKLHQALESLRPNPMFGLDSGDQTGEPEKCPDISFYMADMIFNKHDPDITQSATNQYLLCTGALTSQQNPVIQKTGLVQNAQSLVLGLAGQVLSVGQQESRLSITALKDAVRRLTAMPGQRGLVLASPGFLTPQLEYDYYDLIDRALRAQVTISTLDARGLYVTPSYGDASQRGIPDVDVLGQAVTPASRTQIDLQAATAESDVLMVLASSTGGTFFQNSNDLDAGFRRASDAPASYYVLGFTPQNLKMDGKFHTLKVNLKTKDKYDLQVRRGYYAPDHAEDPAEVAKRELQDELLSSEELHDLPVELNTQFFKPTDDSAKLTVLARLDVKRLRYKRVDGRNENDVTVAMAIFDRNGNFLQGNQKLVQMRWKDETLDKLGKGITLRASFDLKPGDYLVRLVARDEQQQLMSAENGAVQIP